MKLSATQKRFRKASDGKVAELWVDVGSLFYEVELYENGRFVERRRGLRSRTEGIDTLLTGRDFAALVRVSLEGDIRCTWSR